jgi:hypothetical protein
MLAFDFTVYSALDPASRRLFLLLHKLFWRYRRTPPMSVRDLAAHVLGFSASLTATEIKARIRRVADRLRESGVISATRGGWFQKLGKGDYTVRFSRGKHFDKPVRRPKVVDELESPLADPLRSIGFRPNEVRRILQQFSDTLIEQWADVTLAAVEQKGPSFFKRSPQAYFMHNVQQAAQGTRTPPDWWLDLCKQESRAQARGGGQNARLRTVSKPISAGDVLHRMIDNGCAAIAKALVTKT